VALDCCTSSEHLRQSAAIKSIEPSELGFRRPLADAVVDITAISDSLGLIAREINSEDGNVDCSMGLPVSVGKPIAD